MPWKPELAVGVLRFGGSVTQWAVPFIPNGLFEAEGGAESFQLRDTVGRCSEQMMPCSWECAII